MNKFLAIVDLFRKGSAVANPGIWKDATNLGLVLGALIMSVMTFLQTVCNVNLHMDLQTANSIGAGVGCLIAFIVNNISSTHAGVLPAKPEPTVATPMPAPAAPTWDDNALITGQPPSVVAPSQPDTKSASATVRMPPVDAADIEEAWAALNRDRGRK